MKNMNMLVYLVDTIWIQCNATHFLKKIGHQLFPDKLTIIQRSTRIIPGGITQGNVGITPTVIVHPITAGEPFLSRV